EAPRKDKPRESACSRPDLDIGSRRDAAFGTPRALPRNLRAIEPDEDHPGAAARDAREDARTSAGRRRVTNRRTSVCRRHERQPDIVWRDRRASGECGGRWLLDAMRSAGIETVLAVERGPDPEHTCQCALPEE